ncbi:MAG: hypothetical protein PHE43_02460 [Candidatus Nanoarchaeia archaeon]|nr:hypothetical protein [Candidatus Nanoarchaeia archaeon]
MSWREKIDPILRFHLEKQIEESYKQKEAFKSSKNPDIAQLWCAVASLSKENFDLNLKIKYLESLIKDNIKIKKQTNLKKY